MLQLSLLAAVPLAAQPLLSVYDVDPSGFPAITAKFYAIDATGNQVQGLTPGDFTITEDGTPRTVTNVSCPPLKPPTPLTAGVMVDTYQYIDIAGAGIRHLAELLRMLP